MNCRDCLNCLSTGEWCGTVVVRVWLDRFEQARELQRAGRTLNAIAEQTGPDRRTVVKSEPLDVLPGRRLVDRNSTDPVKIGNFLPHRRYQLNTPEEDKVSSRTNDRMPLYTVILPALGIATYLFIGKVGLGPLALLAAAILLGNVLAAVHHAEVVALRLGEPFGTIVLALSVTVIEVGLIVTIMLIDKPNPRLMRDSVHAVVMLVLHGLAGLCIVVCAIRQREVEFRVEGANAYLGVLIPMALLVLVVPNFVVSAPGPYYSRLQLIFVSAACLILYGGVLFIQTGWHRDYFLPVTDGDDALDHEPPGWKTALASFALLLVALLAVVLLAKNIAPAVEAGVRAAGAPLAIVGVIIAAITLLPESAAAIRAALRNRLQSSLNLALGSGVASIGLTVPVVALVSQWVGQPLELGISMSNSVLMVLGFMVAIVTYGTGRTTLLSGIVHLVLLATYIFTIFAP